MSFIGDLFLINLRGVWSEWFIFCFVEFVWVLFRILKVGFLFKCGEKFEFFKKMVYFVLGKMVKIILVYFYVLEDREFWFLEFC